MAGIFKSIHKYVGTLHKSSKGGNHELQKSIEMWINYAVYENSDDKISPNFSQFSL